MRDHRTLDAFRLADDLAVRVYEATRGFPREELYGLVSQLRRSAVSVATNIVEGYGRTSDADCNRFLGIFFGSLRELGYLIDLSGRLEYMTGETAAELSNLQSRTAAALTALMRQRRAVQ